MITAIRGSVVQKAPFFEVLGKQALSTGIAHAARFATKQKEVLAMACILVPPAKDAGNVRAM